MCATVLPHGKLLSALLARTSPTDVALGKLSVGATGSRSRKLGIFDNTKILSIQIFKKGALPQSQPYHLIGVSQQSAILSIPAGT